MAALTATVTGTEYVVACMECRTPVAHLWMNGEGQSRCAPCDHPANLVLIPNPALAAEQED